MKNLWITASVVLAVLVFFSCEKEEVLHVKNEVKVTPMEIDYEYDASINSIGLGLINLTKNDDFRKLVFEECLKTFDGDYNVLLKSLEKSYDETFMSSTSFLEEINNSFSIYRSQTMENENLTLKTEDEIVEAIRGIDYNQTTLYSQIYIPFIEEHTYNDKPVLVIAYEETDDCIARGYQIIGDKINEISVDETFARENLVWVISINERVDEKSNYIRETPRDLNGNNAGSRMDEKLVKVKEVYITDKKECWLCGDAEVSFAALQITSCSQSTQSVDVLYGRDFIAINNNQLNSWQSTSSGLSYMASTAKPLTSAERIGFVLYEKDNKKKSWYRDWTMSGCSSGSNLKVYYYSKQTPYGTTGGTCTLLFEFLKFIKLDNLPCKF
jgi:hypothetical protein